MASFHPSSRRARLASAFAAALGVAAAGLLGPAAAAQAPRESQAIVLNAVPLVIDYRQNTASFRDVVITQGDTRIEAALAEVKGGLDFENGEWTVSGNVRIKAEGGSLSSDKAVVSFSNNLISRAVITGAPAQFEQLRQDGTTAHGRASTIAYEPVSGIVSLRENAWLSDGCNEIKGQELVYNIKQQRVQGRQQQAQTGTGDRITITIQPGGKPGDPCAKPGGEKTP
jgi:lipopolysaccharide transport protein LptA